MTSVALHDIRAQLFQRIRGSHIGNVCYRRECYRSDEIVGLVIDEEKCTDYECQQEKESDAAAGYYRDFAVAVGGRHPPHQQPTEKRSVPPAMAEPERIPVRRDLHHGQVSRFEESGGLSDYDGWSEGRVSAPSVPSERESLPLKGTPKRNGVHAIACCLTDRA